MFFSIPYEGDDEVSYQPPRYKAARTETGTWWDDHDANVEVESLTNAIADYLRVMGGWWNKNKDTATKNQRDVYRGFLIWAQSRLSRARELLKEAGFSDFYKIEDNAQSRERIEQWKQELAQWKRKLTISKMLDDETAPLIPEFLDVRAEKEIVHDEKKGESSVTFFRVVVGGLLVIAAGMIVNDFMSERRMMGGGGG